MDNASANIEKGSYRLSSDCSDREVQMSQALSLKRIADELNAQTHALNCLIEILRARL